MSPIIQSLANGSARGYGAFVPLGAGTAFESIASASGTGSSATITFSSIPSTYQHLQIRGILRGASDAGVGNAGIRLNSDTTEANYASHYLSADGSAIYPYGSNAGPVYLANCFPLNNQTSGNFGALIIDIHDYASTTKFKTIRNFCGYDNNNSPSGASGSVTLGSGLWENTNAVTSITLTGLGVNFTTQTTFALYGIKGA